MAGHGINVKLLRDRIEQSIMTDRQKTELTMTPRDLYVKSNPGLLGTGSDITNPRDWYCSTATRKLLRTFVSQYKNIQSETGPGDAASKQVAFYVNFPKVTKEQTFVSRQKTNLHQEPTAPPPPDQQEMPELMNKDKEPAVAFPHHDYPEQLELRRDSSVSNLVRLPSFSHLRPCEFGTRENTSEGKEKPLRSISLPKLSTRTLNLESQNRKAEQERENTWEKWLSRMPNEVHSARTYRLQGRVKVSKVTHCSFDSDVANNEPLLPLKGAGDDSTRLIPGDYVEFFLPRHKTDLSRSVDIHDNYTWRQKSVLNLKLDYAKDKRHKLSGPFILKEKTFGNLSPRKSKERQYMRENNTSNSETNNKPAQKGGNIGLFPQPNGLAIEAATFYTTKTPLSSEKGPHEAVVVAGAEVGNTEATVPSDTQSNTSRHVYQSYRDGHLHRSGRPIPKPNIVTLGLKCERITEELSMSAGYPTGLSHAVSQPDFRQVENLTSGRSAPSPESSSRIMRSHSLQPSDFRSKSLFSKFQKLEVFSERKENAVTSLVESPGSDDDQGSLRTVTETCGTYNPKCYKPVLRAPTFRTDERDWSICVKSESANSDVKVSKGKEWSLLGRDGSRTFPKMRLTYPTNPCLLIGRVNLDKERHGETDKRDGRQSERQ